MTEDSTNNNHKYFCLKCKDKNYLIECKCGYCNEIRFLRDKNNCLRYYMPYHHHKKENHWNWKNGRMTDKDGYILLLMPDYFSSDECGRVREHVYNFQEYHKCCMLPWGEVHHIIPVKKGGSNLPYNLQGMTKKQHRSLESSIREYELLDTSDRRCSDPDCPHPERTIKRKTKKSGKTPAWRTDGNGNWLCTACSSRRYRRSKKKVTII